MNESKVSKPVDMDISHVRRNIILMFVAAAVIGAIILGATTPLVLHFRTGTREEARILYFLFSPILVMGITIFLYIYLRPIAKLAKLQQSGAPIPPALNQRARTLAFKAPIYFMIIPVVITFVVALLGDLAGLLWVENYTFFRHLLGTVFITIVAASLSLIVSVVARRMLTPVLFFTFTGAQNIGPRFSVRARQFVTTMLLTVIAITFLGLFGHTRMLEITRQATQQTYQQLGESIGEQLAGHLENQALLDYVAALNLDYGVAFVLDESTQRIRTALPRAYDALEAMTPSLLALASTNLADERAIIWDGEVLFFDLSAAEPGWRLGIYYDIQAKDIPFLRSSLWILGAFVVGMFTLVFVTNHYISKEITREINYIIAGMRALVYEREGVDFKPLEVLSLDEVGDLVVAFNAVLDKFQEQQRQLAQEKAELRALLNISHDIGFLLDADQLLDRILASAEEGFGYENILVFMVNQDAREIHCAAAPPHLAYAKGKRWPLSRRSLASEAARTGETQYVAGEERAKLSYFPKGTNIQAELAVPMRVGGKILGVFNVGCLRADAFGERDRRIITAVADQAAVALHNAHLYQEVKRQRETASTLVELAKVINSTLDLNPLLNAALEQLTRVIPYDSASILLIDGPPVADQSELLQQDLVVSAAQGFDNPDEVIGSTFHPEDERDIGYQVMRDQRVKVVPDVRQEPAWGQDQEQIEALNAIRSWIGAPLVVRGLSLGLVTIDSTHTGFYNERYGELAQAFADQIAVAVRNVRLYRTTKERAKQLSLLHEVSQRISAVLDVDKLLAEIVRLVQDAFAYEVVTVHLLDKTTGNLNFVAQQGMDVEIANFDCMAVGGAGVVPWVFEHKRPLVIPDVREEPRYVPIAPDIRSELAVPLMTGKRVIGVFNLESKRADAFNENDVKLMTALAHQITVALENARLFQRQRQQTVELAHMADDLAEEKRRLDAILRNITDGLVVTDAECRVLHANPAFGRMFGVEIHASHGSRLKEALDVEPLYRLIQRVLEDPTATFTSEFSAAGDHIFQAIAVAIQEDSLSTNSANKDQDKNEDTAPAQPAKVRNVVTVVRDITHEKAVDRMKTEFISTVSHELRTPLTSVLGFAKLIDRTFERYIVPQIDTREKRTEQAMQRIRDNLDIIVVEAERLTRLINDVLDISKLESGKIEWQDRLFNLGAIIDRVVARAQPKASDKGLDIATDIERGLPQVVADPSRIQQVLSNLVSNALKFTDEGRIQITARLLAPDEMVHGWQAPPEAEGGVLVSVADTGVGIPQDAFLKLFSRFQQMATDTLTDKPKGTGLGLAISREIVTHYGGIIWAESEWRAGATFHFTLPLRPITPMVENAEIQPLAIGDLAVQSAPRASDESAPTVLIVDDEPHIRSLLVQELEAEGYRVLVAANGKEALALARHHKPGPDIIILDIMLPDISGFDVTRILKVDPVTADIPILILSIIEDRERGLALGAEEYLTKPVETSTLLSTVGALLQRSQIDAESETASPAHLSGEIILDMLQAQGFEASPGADQEEIIAVLQQYFPETTPFDQAFANLTDAKILDALTLHEEDHAYVVLLLAVEQSDNLAERPSSNSTRQQNNP
ncbi:MAG: GAF domain-containing protein [Anaerolineales bacterium]